MIVPLSSINNPLSMVWYFPGFVNSYFRFLYNNLILRFCLYFTGDFSDIPSILSAFGIYWMYWHFQVASLSTFYATYTEIRILVFIELFYIKLNIF